MPFTGSGLLTPFLTGLVESGVNESARRIRARLENLAQVDDTTADLLDVISGALGLGATEVDEVIRETDTHIPWGMVLDPTAAPEWALPWLAIFAGTRLLPSDNVEDSRARISQAAGFYRGTARAIREEVERTLTGTKTVTILERTSGNRWTMTVKVRTSETPDAAATEVAARRQKAAGIVMTFLVSDDPIIDEGTRTVDAGAATIDTATIADVT